jgi:SP family facilitated glucose transporter-like MFS transporter 1
VIGVLFGPFQFGWSLSQLNLSTYHNEADCGADPIVDGTCIMFPGHTPGQWTILVNAWIIGGMCGSLMSGTPAAKYGRKRVICGNGLIMIIGALVQAFSTNLWIFGVGRFIAGLASGCALAVTASYLNEISPPH